MTISTPDCASCAMAFLSSAALYRPNFSQFFAVGCQCNGAGVMQDLVKYPQIAYIFMKAVFIELPAFERYRSDYLDDEAFRALQRELMKSPEAGELIEGTGGLRKLRFADARRGKGKRGGLRVIYFYWDGKSQFWLFSLYDKDEAADLTPVQRAKLKVMIKKELEARK